MVDRNRLVGKQGQLRDVRQAAHLPQRGSPIEFQAAQRVRFRQQHESGTGQADADQRGNPQKNSPSPCGRGLGEGACQFRPYLRELSATSRSAHSCENPVIRRKPRRSAPSSSVQSHSLAATSMARTSTPCSRASRTICAGA